MVIVLVYKDSDWAFDGIISEFVLDKESNFPNGSCEIVVDKNFRPGDSEQIVDYFRHNSYSFLVCIGTEHFNKRKISPYKGNYCSN